MKEILKGRVKFEDLDTEIQSNLLILLERINKVRARYGKPMRVNDGLRIVSGNGAKTSNHLRGAAIDIDDNDAGDLWKWCLDNLEFIKECGLWLEDPRWTHGKVGTWMHFQIYAPVSGKRIFRPSMNAASAPELWDGKYDANLD